MKKPATPAEALAAIQQAAAEGCIEFGSDTFAAQLDEQIQAIFRELRDVMGLPPPKRPVWIADSVTVGGSTQVTVVDAAPEWLPL